MVNQVIIVGRVGSVPELRHSGGGSAVTNFSVATNESWNGKDGKRQERTEWHKIVVWGKTAEACASVLKKGRQVYVSGKLVTRSWTDKEGKTKFTTEIQANHVVFLGGPPSELGELPEPGADG